MNAETAARSIVLEDPGLRQRRGYDVWDNAGKLIVRAASGGAMWRRRTMAYFRDNSSGRIYRAISRERTEEIPPGAIAWRVSVPP